MSLNPIDAIEKLINEHGSAAILKERLELAADQYTALERKVTELEIKAKKLETDNQDLRSKLQQCEAQIHALEVAAQLKRTGDRDETEQRILMLLSSSSDGRDVYQIAKHLTIGEQVARYHLSELSDAELICYQPHINSEGKWRLAQDGRRYLIQRGLIQ